MSAVRGIFKNLSPIIQHPKNNLGSVFKIVVYGCALSAIAYFAYKYMTSNSSSLKKRIDDQGKSNNGKRPEQNGKMDSSSSIPILSSVFSFLKEKVKVFSSFAQINSSVLGSSDLAFHTRAEALKNANYKLNPVVISKSAMVSDRMAEHLMRNKRHLAIGQKYETGTKITNMEGALHTFMTPICSIQMRGDYKYEDKHSAVSHGGRQVVLSASIHPDFELDNESAIIMKLIELQDKEVIGQEIKEIDPYFTTHDPAKTRRGDEEFVVYEKSLQQHMIYHLTKAHKLPAKRDVKVLEMDLALHHIKFLIQTPSSIINLEGNYLRLNDRVISLEVLFNIYVHQIRNEFIVLDNLLPQGYVYTIDPPSIFARTLGAKNVPLLNRLQTLAFKFLKNEILFKNLKIIGFNNWADKEAIPLYNEVFPDKMVCPKADLFKAEGVYSVKDPYALVIHNNSDAFGQNIENETGKGSMDAIIGTYSDAAAHLKRDRADLMTFLQTN